LENLEIMADNSLHHDLNLCNYLEGVIWDMDGVLIDSMEIQFDVWQNIFQSYGVDFQRKDFNRHFGTTNLETIQFVLGDKLTAEESIALADKKQSVFEKIALQHAKLIPGVTRWLEFFELQKIPQTIASSNAQRFIEAITSHLEIASHFRAIVSAENLASKPDPAVFLESARRIQAEPSSCLVFEDAMAGVEGARRAGMKCIAITTTNPPSALTKADLIIAEFSALSSDQVLKLMRS
jgi:beta-phosphoglucomutase